MEEADPPEEMTIMPVEVIVEDIVPPMPAPETPMTPDTQDGVLTELSVTDLSDGSSTWFEQMNAATIVLADYPQGFSIRAEVADPSLVQSVLFTTDDGHSHTETKSPYDMFGSRGPKPWPNPQAGAAPL